MSMLHPTQPLRELRNTTPRRTCHELGICQHPYAQCGDTCEMPPLHQRLAPGVLDGPYSRSPAAGTAPWRGAALRLALLTLGITIVLGVLYVSL